MSVRHRIKSERGEGVVLASAVIALLIIAATLAFHAAHVYSAKAQLQAVADEVVSYAGAFLPNGQAVCERAFDAFEVLKLNVESGAVEKGLEFTEAEVTLGSHGPSAPGDSHMLNKTQCLDNLVSAPIGDLGFSLNGYYRVDFINIAGIKISKKVTYKVQAKSRIIPTDVVLVIDNSNSVVTPLEAAPAALESSPFAAWANDFAGRVDSESDGLYSSNGGTPISLAELRLRQCFGKTTRNIKTAALKAYDLLAASYQMRVGVVHTFSPNGEYGLSTVNIQESPADSQSPPEIGTQFSPKGLLGLPLIGGEYNGHDFELSRCAAWTSGDVDGGFPMPAHALAGKVAIGSGDSNPASILKCDGAAGGEGCPAGGIEHLAIDPAELFFPRQFIWINSAGRSGASGLLDADYDFAATQFAIQRAVDMLQRAPARIDGLEVRRRIVLVFTDGFDQPKDNSDLTGERIPHRFGRVVQNVAASAEGFTAENTGFQVLATPTPGFEAEAPEGSGERILTSYCEEAAGEYNPLLPLTEVKTGGDPAENLTGIKLGVLYYTDRYAVEGDPLAALAEMPGHKADETSIDKNFRGSCNTPWSVGRGRFMVETKKNPQQYADIIVPEVARALFVSELVK